MNLLKLLLSFSEAWITCVVALASTFKAPPALTDAHWLSPAVASQMSIAT